MDSFVQSAAFVISSRASPTLVAANDAAALVECAVKDSDLTHLAIVNDDTDLRGFM